MEATSSAVERARIVGCCRFAEISRSKRGADVLELDMVEGVEGLEAQFKLHLFSQVDGLEQGHVEVQQSWSNNRVSAGISEAVVRTCWNAPEWPCRPRGKRGRKRTLVKPTIW